MAASNPSSSSSASRWTSDVFLCFRGEDTRHNITSQLYAALAREGINTFKDDITLRKGELISEALEKAIKESKISIIIFSPNFANSRWCLEEVELIIQCWEKYGQKVIPVFLWGVEGSDVRRQKGSFGEHLGMHEHLFGRETVERWRSALKIAGELCGWNSKDFDGEEELIQKIVEDILWKLGKEPMEVPKEPIGVDANALHTETRADNVLSGGIRWGVDVTALESVLSSRRAENVLSGEEIDVNALHTEAAVTSSSAENVFSSGIQSTPENVLSSGIRGGMDFNALRSQRIIPYKAAENALSDWIRDGMDVNALRSQRIIPYKAAKNVLSGGIRGGADGNAVRTEAVMSSRGLTTAENVITGELGKQAAKKRNLFFILFYLKKRSCRPGLKIPKMQKMLSLIGYGGNRGN